MLEKMEKRNSFILEVTNLVTEALAFLGWFGYFFTSELEKYLGEYSLITVIGVSVLALIINFFYVRQLGDRHRVVNIMTDLFELVAVAGLSTLWYGTLSFREVIATKSISFDQVVESLELAIAQPEAISLFAFLGVQLLLLLFVNKK